MEVHQYHFMAYIFSFWWRMIFKNTFRIDVHHIFSQIWCGRPKSKNSEKRPLIIASILAQSSFKFEWNTERIATLNPFSWKFYWIFCRKNIFEVIVSYFAMLRKWKEPTAGFSYYVRKRVKIKAVVLEWNIKSPYVC